MNHTEHTHAVWEKDGNFLLTIISVCKLTTRFEMVETAFFFPYTLFENYFNFLKYIIIIITIISFMQGIYTYIPETNHVPKQ
jgi:hypothetical protein